MALGFRADVLEMPEHVCVFTRVSIGWRVPRQVTSTQV